MEETTTILGDYAKKINSLVFTQENPDRVSIAALHNKRLVYVEEPPKKATIDVERIKDWTGKNVNFSKCRLCKFQQKCA